MTKKNQQKDINLKRARRHKKQRSKVKGTKDRPRLSVFRSNNHIFCQAIDDNEGKTIVAAGDIEIKKNIKSKKETAFMVGDLIAKKLLKKRIKKVVFDKGWFAYHGKVKSLADGARKGGLSF